MSADACYQVLIARDARYDGRLFVGVRTTGIFCRPVCTARKPKRENVAFYWSAAGAAEAGFRPCLRCRPEVSPGTPAWDGTEVTVRRALRLIGDGALDDAGIEDLAARVGMGPRHLRRLFQQHVGAAPIAVARMRRVLFAKRLIDGTQMPFARVAMSSGFNSLRRFNAEIRHVYHESPSELRARRLRRSGTAGSDIRLELAARPPFDWDGIHSFLTPRAIPGVEWLSDGCYQRTFVMDGRKGALKITPSENHPGITLTIHADDNSGLIRITERVRRMFDLDADPATIASHLGNDPALSPLLEACPGRRVPGAWDPFELAIRAVLGQQVTVKGATTLSGRIAEQFGDPIEIDGMSELSRLFPAPECLARTDLSNVGLPKQRQQTVHAIARGFVAGTLPGEADSMESIVARWMKIPGIGPWTAHYVAMRAFGEPDAFPCSDLGLRKAVAGNDGNNENSGTLPTPAKLRQRAEGWRPWRAYAAMHLWSSL